MSSFSFFFSSVLAGHRNILGMLTLVNICGFRDSVTWRFSCNRTVLLISNCISNCMSVICQNMDKWTKNVIIIWDYGVNHWHQWEGGAPSPISENNFCFVFLLKNTFFCHRKILIFGIFIEKYLPLVFSLKNTYFWYLHWKILFFWYFDWKNENKSKIVPLDFKE